jgi:hypothetical protein
MSAIQLAFPIEVNPEEVLRKHTFGSAINLCLELADIPTDKTCRIALEERGFKVDKAQFSRWQDGSEGIMWNKLNSLMDVCGNDAPILWMLGQRNFDLHSLRRKETELERENRLLREENAALRRSMRTPA